MKTYAILHPGADDAPAYTNCEGADADDALARFLARHLADAPPDQLEGFYAVCVEPTPGSEATR